MSDYELEGSQHLYPVSLDDPARQLAYDKDSAAKWLDSRGCSRYPATPPPYLSTITNPWLYPMVPGWILDKASDSARKCMLLCFTGDQVEVTSCLFRTLLPDHFAVDNTENEAYFVHVVRAIQFSAAVRGRQSNLGEPANPPSGWPILYNFFFETIRTDAFQHSHVDISYIPRWSLRGDITPRVSHIVPDAVFYVHVDGTRLFPDPEQRNTQQNQLIIEYDEPLLGLQHDINVPILVVEYVKTNLFVDDGASRHRDHLLMAMSSASGLYKTLGISLIPVFGLLVDRVESTLFMGWECDHPIVGMRHCKLAPFRADNPFDALRLRLLLANVPDHVTRVRTALQEACPRLLETMENGTLHCWKQLIGSVKEQSGSSQLKLSIEEWRGSLGDNVGDMWMSRGAAKPSDESADPAETTLVETNQ